MCFAFWICYSGGVDAMGFKLTRSLVERCKCVAVVSWTAVDKQNFYVVAVVGNGLRFRFLFFDYTCIFSACKHCRNGSRHSRTRCHKCRFFLKVSSIHIKAFLWLLICNITTKIWKLLIYFIYRSINLVNLQSFTLTNSGSQLSPFLYKNLSWGL